LIIIYNPTAGARRRSVLWRVLDILAGNGVRVELAETCRRGHAAEIAHRAAAEACRLVVAAGGDGTIAEVAAGLNGSDVPLGVVPMGTANVLARELGLPFAPERIAAALAFGRTRALWPGIATGRAGERLFVQMLGVGLDAQVVHNLPIGLKRVIGRYAYVTQTLREMLRYPYPPVRLRVDGRDLVAGSAVVSKGSLYAGQYLLAPGARPDQPGFSVALFGRRGPGAVLLYGAALQMNLLPKAPGMSLLRAERVEFLDGDGLPAQADGDPAGATPLAIRNAPRPIRVVVP
jgi:YegS/Rv2252/BmrU family lipid kinase